MDRRGALAAIGHTPVVRVGGAPDEAEIWVKLESANPTGSYKDRMALAMIEAAEADGRLSRARPWSSTPAAAPAHHSRSCAR